MSERGGVTTDDATLLMLEWTGASADHLIDLEGHTGPTARPTP